jgi:hypothetical protein
MCNIGWLSSHHNVVRIQYVVERIYRIHSKDSRRIIFVLGSTTTSILTRMIDIQTIGWYPIRAGSSCWVVTMFGRLIGSALVSLRWLKREAKTDSTPLFRSLRSDSYNISYLISASLSLGCWGKKAGTVYSWPVDLWMIASSGMQGRLIIWLVSPGSKNALKTSVTFACLTLSSVARTSGTRSDCAEILAVAISKSWIWWVADWRLFRRKDTPLGCQCDAWGWSSYIPYADCLQTRWTADGSRTRDGSWRTDWLMEQGSMSGLKRVGSCALSLRFMPVELAQPRHSSW